MVSALQPRATTWYVHRPDGKTVSTVTTVIDLTAHVSQFSRVYLRHLKDSYPSANHQEGKSDGDDNSC